MVSDFFAQNWVDEFVETHSWRTVISAGEETLSEQRIQQVERPYRSFRLRWTGCDAGEANAMRYQLHRGAQDRWQIPLYPDVWILENAVPNGTFTITNVDTTNRRFYQGHKVVFVDRFTGNAQVHEILLIGAPGPSTTITLTAGLLFGLPAGSYMYPVVEVEPIVQPPRVEWVNSEIVNITMEVNEVVGPTALPSTNNGGFPGGGGGVQDKPGVAQPEPIFPVLDLADGANWRDNLNYAVARTGQSFPQGRDVLYDLRGPRARETLDHPMTTCQNRADWWQILQWHDNRKGRTRGFWLPAPHRAFEIVSVNANQIVVKAWGTDQAALDNINEFVDYIALVGDQNDTVMAGNAQLVSLFGDEWTIPFTSAVILPTNLIYATTGHFVRFASDTLSMRWLTAAGTVEFGSIQMVEIFNDTPNQLGTFP